MPSTDNMYTRTFVFSKTQHDEILELERKHNNKIKFGQVIVNGISHIYTEMIPPGRQSRFSDARVLIKGDIRKLKFTTRDDL